MNLLNKLMSVIEIFEFVKVTYCYLNILIVYKILLTIHVTVE